MRLAAENLNPCWRWSLAVSLAICLLLVVAGVAQEPGRPTTDNGKSAAGNLAPGNQKDQNQKDRPAAESKKRPAAKLPAYTAQREAAALSFVGEHHPELAGLLAHLKRGDKKQYQQAIRELFRTSERLAQLRERDEQRWEIDLEIWRLQSRIRLMSARLTMDPKNVVLKQELFEALVGKTDLRLARFELDRQRQIGRLDRIETAIQKLRRSRETQAEQIVNRLLRNAGKTRARKNKPSGGASAAGAATVGANSSGKAKGNSGGKESRERKEIAVDVKRSP